KVAKFVGLPYPGGPQIEKHAREGHADPKRFPFPMPQFKDESFDFSYSGIKAAAIRLARQHQIHVGGDAKLLADFCATFQAAMIAFAGLQKGEAADPRRVSAKSRIG